jgi:hypothetical protein
MESKKDIIVHLAPKDVIKEQVGRNEYYAIGAFQIGLLLLTSLTMCLFAVYGMTLEVYGNHSSLILCVIGWNIMCFLGSMMFVGGVGISYSHKMELASYNGRPTANMNRMYVVGLTYYMLGLIGFIIQIFMQIIVNIKSDNSVIVVYGVFGGFSLISLTISIIMSWKESRD